MANPMHKSQHQHGIPLLPDAIDQSAHHMIFLVGGLALAVTMGQLVIPDSGRKYEGD